jgi:hypothetical protein
MGAEDEMKLVSVEDVIDPTYLPFTAQQLAEHFADNRGDHLAYYQASAERARALTVSPPVGTAEEIRRAIKWGRQLEKDERFWVAATLMRLFHAPDRVTVLAEILRSCLSDTPPDSLPSWEAALGQEQFLYFEASLPSPASYRHQLAYQLDERILVPYLREAAGHSGEKLEGPTKVDALLISPDTGFAAVFEAKVISDISAGVQFDVLRNQIARNIDVTLDPNSQLQPPLSERVPARTCFVLLTPEIFRTNPESRLYGWLLPAYQQDPALLHHHLPHRPLADVESVSKRLGWLAWEDCNRLYPSACPWLQHTQPGADRPNGHLVDQDDG